MKKLPFVLALLLIGCGSTSSNGGAGGGGAAGAGPAGDGAGGTGDGPSGGADVAGNDGAGNDGWEGNGADGGDQRTFDPAEWLTFEAGPFVVPAGKEKFFCFSHSLEEDISVDEIAISSRPVVHHLVYSKTGNQDPEGFFECEVLFKNNWVPVFVAGTGNASLKMPEGSGHILTKGTQLTMQLHLLNTGLEDLTEMVPIHLHKMSGLPEKKVEVVVFGGMNIALPAGEKSDVVADCSSDSDMNIFTVFPHMHLLGQRMVFETGPDEDHLTEVFRSDPYDFDDQQLAKLDIAIKRGDSIRLTCSYDNYLDQTVGFGESTTNEMCFLIGFATEATHELAGCIGAGGGGASAFIPEACGTDPPNDIGLGASCSAGGQECNAGLICTEDIEQVKGPETCLGFGCEAASECGEGGVCCAVPAGGGITLCLPPSCVFSGCTALP